MEERNLDSLIRQEGFKDIRDDPGGKLSFIWGTTNMPYTFDAVSCFDFC